MEYTTEQIQEMAKIEANDKKHEHIKLDYQDGIYYGFQQGFERALSLFAVSGSSAINRCDECSKELESGTVFCSADCRQHYYH